MDGVSNTGGSDPRHEIAVISTELDWSTERLIEAVEDRVGDRPLLIDPNSVTLTAEGPALEGKKVEPKLAITRRLAPADFQSGLTSSLYGYLETTECRVINRFRSVAMAANKAESNAILARKGIPTPRFLVTREVEEARGFLEEWGRVVQKPVYGYQGRGVRILTDEDSIDGEGPIYLQSFVENPGWDGRIFVGGGKPIASMRRRSEDWRTNIARGGRAEVWSPSEETSQMAVKATNALGLDYSAVDLIGEPEMVMEVNGTPGWRGLQEVAEIDVADKLARIFLKDFPQP